MLNQLTTTYAKRLRTGQTILSQIAGLYNIGVITSNEKATMTNMVKKGMKEGFDDLYAYAFQLSKDKSQIQIITNTILQEVM